MIHHVLAVITDQLNEFIRNELNLAEDMVVMNSIVDIKGNMNMQVDNRVCLFLLRIDEERLLKSGGFQSNAGMSPPLHINLHIGIAANFPDPNYKEALRYISLVLEFFQGRYVFDRSNTPALSGNIDKLRFEMVNLEYSELNNLWSLIGGKYIPSLIYKIKMLTFNQSMIREDVPSIIQSYIPKLP